MSQQNKVSYAVIPGIRISEKNLLPTCKTYGTTQGITFELRPDGSVYAHGTATGTAYCNFVHSSDPIPLPAGEYNISPGTNLSVGYIAISRADDRTVLASSSTKESGTNTRFILTEETQIYAYLRFPVNAVVDAVIYPQLERGSAATEYEPYEIIEGFTRKIKKKYLVIDGVTCKITKKYRVVDGVTRLVYSATEDISAAEITLASGTLTYNGSSQTKNVSSVVLNGKTLVEGTDYTVSGNTGTNAGSYTLTITGIGDYEGEAYAEFSIAKATGKISVSPTSLSIAGVKGTTKTATISYTGDGSISVKSGSTGVATVTRSGNTVTVKSVATGTATITITLAAGTNYTGASCTISVSSSVVSSTLNDNDWATIKSITADDKAANYWSVGDTKAVTLNGTVGSQTFSNQTFYAFIIGINHNESIEGKGLHFMMAKTAAKSGKDVVFKCGSMNTSATNSGGWSGSNMCKTICPAFLNALPSELRGAIASCVKYSDNQGGTSTSASKVTSSSSEIWLPAEFEILGARYGANSAEQNYQKQYAYYKNGNSAIKYKSDAPTTACAWWLRSADAGSSTAFRDIRTGGSSAETNASVDNRGISPCFKIA